jgi:hypothetical protein
MISRIYNCRRAGAVVRGWVGDMSLSSRSHAISVAIMAWNGEQRAFVIKTYLKKTFLKKNAQ